MLQTWRRPFYILKTNLMIGELILAVLGVINNFKEAAAWLYCQFTNTSVFLLFVGWGVLGRP